MGGQYYVSVNEVWSQVDALVCGQAEKSETGGTHAPN